MEATTTARVFLQYNTGVLHSRRDCSVRKGTLTFHVPKKLTAAEVEGLLLSGNWRNCDKCGGAH